MYHTMCCIYFLFFFNLVFFLCFTIHFVITHLTSNFKFFCPALPVLYSVTGYPGQDRLILQILQKEKYLF